MINKPLFHGDRVKLTAFQEEDAAVLAAWHEDDEFLQLFDARPAVPKSKKEMEEWISSEESDSFRFAIRLKGTEELAGFIEIDGILWNHGCAWISAALQRQYWSQGYGTEAMSLAIRYAFEELNLHRLQLTVFSYNARAKRMYEKLGFIKEGSYREFLERRGRRHDLELYGMLKREWMEKEHS